MDPMTTRTRKPSPDANAAQLAGHDGFSLISNEKLLQIYSTMVKCRLLERKTRVLLETGKRAEDGKAGAGHEAAAVGVAIDLIAGDTIAASPLGFLLDFIQGAPLKSVVRRMSGRTAGPRTIAAQLKAAGSAALVNKTKKNGKVVVAFLGDLPASIDFLEEAFHFAGVHQLPILFVCRNGAASKPASGKKTVQPEELALKAQACGIPCIPVDGDDAVAVYRVATESIAHARRSNGATVIECKTLAGQTLAEAASAKHRAPLATRRKKAGDPLRNMEEYLTRKGLFSKEVKRKAAAGFGKELEGAIAAAQSSPAPARRAPVAPARRP
jgi:TPP-dependent pyruvate/acetoin dehydrogenase alpha subunit